MILQALLDVLLRAGLDRSGDLVGDPRPHRRPDHADFVARDAAVAIDVEDVEDHPAQFFDLGALDGPIAVPVEEPEHHRAADRRFVARRCRSRQHCRGKRPGGEKEGLLSAWRFLFVLAGVAPSAPFHCMTRASRTVPTDAS